MTAHPPDWQSNPSQGTPGKAHAFPVAISCDQGSSAGSLLSWLSHNLVEASFDLFGLLPIIRRPAETLGTTSTGIIYEQHKSQVNPCSRQCRQPPMSAIDMWGTRAVRRSAPSIRQQVGQSTAVEASIAEEVEAPVERAAIGPVNPIAEPAQQVQPQCPAVPGNFTLTSGLYPCAIKEVPGHAAIALRHAALVWPIRVFSMHCSRRTTSHG